MAVLSLSSRERGFIRSWFSVFVDMMIIGMPDWIGASAVVYTADEAFGGLGRGGLIAVIVISVIAIVTFVWIFRETGRRD